MKESLFEMLANVYGEKSAWSEVESVLKSEGTTIDFSEFFDPFKNLIIGILSQVTSDRNSIIRAS